MNSEKKMILDTAKIKSLLRYAVLAPSSHNTQPWYFEITDRKVSLYADRARALPANDPDDRELTISCGCVLMNLRVVAAHKGLSVTIDTAPHSTNGDLLAVVSFDTSDSSPPDEAQLFKSIEERRTYRKHFESKGVPTSVLESLSLAASEENSWLEVIESEKNRQKAAALVSEGDSIQWSNASWRRELAAWMHPRSRGDGLTVPGIIAPIAKVVVRTFDMGKRVGAKDKQLTDEAPVLAVLGTAGDDGGDWLAAGQALERVLLTANSNGLQASYLNQPIQVTSLRPKLQNVMSQPGFPQILLRLGFPKDEIAATPRRSLDAVVN